jgi:hypothetical protein
MDSSVDLSKQAIDQYSRFLEPTIPKGQLDYYNDRKPLISKELSVGNIERSDMIGYFDIEDAILEFLEEGQIGVARFLMTRWQTELKLTMSFDGRFMEQITTSKFEYSQKQDIHEHIEPVKRKGIFGGMK